jgi:glycosyl transferase family 2
LTGTEQNTVHASIDLPASGAEVTTGSLRIAGWAFDELGPLRGALIVVGDAAPRRVDLGLWRSDVGEAFSSVPHAGASGFRCNIELRALTPGPLPITLLVETAAGGWEQAASVEVSATASSRLEGGPRPRAAFTIVQNEPVMLPLWLAYYGRFFDPDDLYVLDHDGTDESVEAVKDRCRVVPVHRSTSFDHRWLRSTVEAFQAFLLRSYDVVLFAEADEFLIADPREYSGLDQYIERLDRAAARCVGFNVVHQADEAPLRFDDAILAQRRYWHASLDYSKRLLSRVPLRWSEGFHEEYDAPDDPPDSSLLLVHLHRVDYDWCLDRHRATAARNWNEPDAIRGDGAQNRIAAPEQFEHWFRQGADLDSPRELIPEHLRAVL